MVQPTPGLDVPVVNQTGQMNQSWYEYFQSLIALLNSTTATADAAAAATFVSSIDTATGAITLSYPLSRSSQALLAALTPSTNALGADVALNNIANYFDGPSIAQGSTGTWLVFGTVTVIDTGATAAVYCKLWDGTTVIASGAGYSSNLARGVAVSLSGIITSPAGNLRISCRDPDATTGKILFNQTGNSKDSHITAVRIA